MNMTAPNSPATPEETVLSKTDENLVWLDCEMSGLDPETHRILEIAVVVTDSQLQVVAHAHFDDDALIGHGIGSISNETEMAALAMTVGLPSGRGISRPPWVTLIVGWP